MPARGSGQASPREGPRRGGSTLPEMLTVLLVLLIGVGIGLPWANAALRQLRLRSGAWQLASELHLARQRAVTLNRTPISRVIASGSALRNLSAHPLA